MNDDSGGGRENTTPSSCFAMNFVTWAVVWEFGNNDTYDFVS